MKFSYQILESCCNELQQEINKIKNILDDISICKNNLNNNWVGYAGNAYTSKLKELTLTFQEVKMILDDSLLFLQNALEEYSSLDKSVIMGINNLLGGK